MQAGRPRGIHEGEIWAYRRGKNYPLVPVRIVKLGPYYEHDVRIEAIDKTEPVAEFVRRQKLPCKWDLVESYLAEFNEKEEQIAEQKARESALKPNEKDARITDQDLFVLANLTSVVTHPIAYDLVSAGAAVGYSSSTIRLAINRGELVARYANSKAIVLHDDLVIWARNLPYEPP